MLVAGTALGPPAVAGPADLFGTYVDADSAFSPNGDGRHDTWRLRFDLVAKARVAATVRHDGKVVRMIDLGRLDKGSHRVVWDGRGSGGAALPDGGYDVRLVASTRTRHDTLDTYAEIDRVNRGRLVTSRRTVYPLATATYDWISFVFLEKGWNAEDATYYGMYQEKSSLTIADPAGHVVFVERHGATETPTFSWEARYPTVAAEGDYMATVVTEDGAGNRVRRSVRVSVSHAQLVSQMWTGTVAASQAVRYAPFFGGCLGCADTCGVTASQRFPRGITYGPCQSFFVTREYYSMDLPFVPAPVDWYRVLVNGGPTTPGAQDRGRLAVGEVLGVQTAVGDGTTASPWVPVKLASQPYLPGLHRPILWSFGTDTPASYDAASFTVEYQYYVPVT
jgi:hypothetical protein